MNHIDFVSSMIYGDLGATDLGAAPAGVKNHMNWSLDRVTAPPPAATRGVEFLQHHVDVMLARYEQWRALGNLPPVRPWDGTDIYHEDGVPPTNPPDPQNLRSGSLPAGWTLNDLGNAVESYYNALRNHDFDGTELQDEVKAPFSYRYWAFVKWAGDLRKRLLMQPVIPVAPVFDRDGTILSEKDFTDVFNQVHHVWHPNSGEPPWTQATPYFKTGVGQRRRKKNVSRTYEGAEFYAFHREHLVLFDRWLARTGQPPVQSLNMCGHDAPGGVPPAPPAGLDVLGPGTGYPLVDYQARTVDWTPPHHTIWDGTDPAHDGTLREFANLGEMGQFIAPDFNAHPFISVPGVPFDDVAYHGEGHMLNGDIAPPPTNNHVPRFFAWHGFLDETWARRQPRFQAFEPTLVGGVPFPGPQVLTIVRDYLSATDAVEPANAVGGLNLATGQGTLTVKLRVRPDPFNRPLELHVRCEVLREAAGPSPVIVLTRTLTVTPGAPTSKSERQQGVDFLEEFVFDGSPGTLDAGGKGPFAADNLDFPPAGAQAVGFVNSAIRVTARLLATQRPDGTVPAVSGTLSAAGISVTGAGTAFTTQLRQGDLVRAAGQVRVVTVISGDTSLQIDEPFSPAIPAGSTYERLDGFDHEETVEIPLVQEKLAPDVTALLDRSTFSRTEVESVAVGGTSTFPDSFYLLVQDRTQRPAPIAWPPDVLPELHGLIAPPVRAAGLFADLAHAPVVELRDAATDAPLAGQVDVVVTHAQPEDPSLHPSVPQRVTYRCQVVFTGTGAFAGMGTGDFRELKLVVRTRDRAGNEAVDDSARVRLQVSANPFMTDGTPAWLSTDTRVLKVNQGEARFGVAAGWTDPAAFIQQVIDNLRAGNGTAGGESFDALPTDQAGAVLEYSTQVNGVNVHNFALAKVRLISASATDPPGVRAIFRLFRWGTANVSFDPTLAYRRAASGVGLLGLTTSNELASIPFFAAPRVSPATPMSAQLDDKNVEPMGPTGGAEQAKFFGAYLDINQPTPRFPATLAPPSPDDGFGAVPPAQMRSIRDLLVGHHQCMVVELAYAPDPTPTGATPGTSDNLSQRNLLIVQTANPGLVEATRTVAHSFDVDLTRHRCGADCEKTHFHEKAAPAAPRRALTHARDHHAHDRHAHERDAHGHDGHGHDGHDHGEPIRVLPARPRGYGRSAAHGHRKEPHVGWLAGNPELLRKMHARAERLAADEERWSFDLDRWKRTDGVDELAFFWNNLPAESRVEVYLPGISVGEVVNYRNLRHAPGTVRIVDNHTLRLDVAGPTFLPIPPLHGDNLAGLVTVTLPKGIVKGQKFTVDVLQLRGDEKRVLGAFQLNVQVDKAPQLIEAEKRILQVFHQRLSLTPKESRWRPVLEKEAALARARARGFVELAKQEGGKWEDPTGRQKGQRIRVVLERIEILDDHDKEKTRGAGEFRLQALAHSRNNGGQEAKTAVPPKGSLVLSDKPGKNAKELDQVLFEGWVEDHFALEIRGVERDRPREPVTHLGAYKRVFVGAPDLWLGRYAPSDERVEPEHVGDWKVWYRIERA